MRKLFAPFALTLALGVLWPAAAQAQVVIVAGEITADTTWTRDNTYVLSGAVFVRAGAALTIEAGTLIVGEQATNGALIIDRDAQIFALGTERQPIIFTSDQPVGQRARSDWGGVIINGRAPLNVPGGIAEGEGDTGLYGGNDPGDSSGILNYVRVEFAGTEFSPDNELNGIAFQGVGSGTEVDFIQVHMNKDDGVEFFGGTVNAKHLVLTNNADDSLDATDGWTGKVQYVVIQQRGDDADNGFEIDNNAEANNRKPRTAPTIYNVTSIGDPDADEGDESDLGMLLREGMAGTFRNIVVMGFKEWGVVITNESTLAEARKGNLSISNTVWFDNGSAVARFAGEKHWSDNSDDSPVPALTTAMFMGGEVNDAFTNNLVEDPLIRKPYKLTGKINVRPRKNSPLLAGNGAVVAGPPAGDDFIEAVDFIGAMGPRLKDDWARKWITRAQS